MNSPAELTTGPAHAFADWPDPDVPRAAAGVYTIWRDEEFVYVGMSGRAATVDSLRAAAESGKRTGLQTRLNSHASGRRSGDQFCVYVADRFVLPTLTSEQVHDIAEARLSFDSLVKRYIHDRLAYRWCVVPTGSEALQLERTLRLGQETSRKPLLNPL